MRLLMWSVTSVGGRPNSSASLRPPSPPRRSCLGSLRARWSPLQEGRSMAPASRIYLKNIGLSLFKVLLNMSIVRWIGLRLPFYIPGLESHAQRFFQSMSLIFVIKNENKQKRPEMAIIILTILKHDENRSPNSITITKRSSVARGWKTCFFTKGANWHI